MGVYGVIHTIYSVICGHDKSAPTVDVRGKRCIYEDKYRMFMD